MTPKLNGLAALAASIATLFAPGFGAAEPVCDPPGVPREVYFVGYGLVAGLNYSGDTFKNCAFARNTVETLLDHTSDKIDKPTRFEGHVAIVIVTAHAPTSSSVGSPMEVTVTALCNARSLLGGTLLPTSMVGPDGMPYAVAQGVVSPWLEARGDVAGRIPGGAVVVRALMAGR